MALRLRLFDPGAQAVADFNQAIHVLCIGHELGAQCGIATGQGGHLAEQLQLHGPARYRPQLRHGVLHRQFAQVVLGSLHQLDHGRRRQVFFAGEMLIQAGFGNAHGGSDFIHRHGLKTFLCQQCAGGLDDGVLARL